MAAQKHVLGMIAEDAPLPDTLDAAKVEQRAFGRQLTAHLGSLPGKRIRESVPN